MTTPSRACIRYKIIQSVGGKRLSASPGGKVTTEDGDEVVGSVVATQWIGDDLEITVELTPKEGSKS